MTILFLPMLQGITLSLEIKNKFTFTPRMIPINTTHKWILYLTNDSEVTYLIKRIDAHYAEVSQESRFTKNGFLTIHSDLKEVETLKNAETIKASMFTDELITMEQFDGVGGYGLFDDAVALPNVDLSYPLIPGKNKLDIMMQVKPNANIVIGGYTDKHEDAELALIIHGHILRGSNAESEE